MYQKKVPEIKDKRGDILERRKLHSEAIQLFESSEREQKQQLLQFVPQSCQLGGKNIGFTLKKLFELILRLLLRDKVKKPNKPEKPEQIFPALGKNPWVT